MSKEGAWEIVLLEQPIAPEDLRRLVVSGFGDMVKYVVDLHRQIIAIGGELHADGEATLLSSGSRPWDLWGANYYPGKGREGCIEYTSLINIRPTQENPGLEIESESIREQVRELTLRLVGRGDPL